MFSVKNNLLSRILPYNAYRFVTRQVHSALRTGRFYDDGRRLDFFGFAFKSLVFNGIDGDYVEFGCHSCQTFHSAYVSSRKAGHRCKLWACDSFCGLPPQTVPEDEHPVWYQGNMSTGEEQFHGLCKKYGIPRASYETVPGFYKDSLRGPNQDRLPRNIALAYIDCDLYSSTMDVLDFLVPRFKHGMILAFDDWYCFSPTRDSGERAAFLDVVEKTPQWTYVPFLQMPWGGRSFIVCDSSRTRPSDRGL